MLTGSEWSSEAWTHWRWSTRKGLLLLQSLSLHFLLLEPLFILPLILVLVVTLCFLNFISVHSLPDLVIVVLLRSEFAITSDQVLTVTVSTIAESLKHGRISTKGSTVGV